MTVIRSSTSSLNGRTSIVTSLPSPPPTPPDPLSQPKDSDPKPPYSTVVEALSGAQGTISVISALQAGFLYAGLSSVQLDDFDGVRDSLSYSFSVVSTGTIAVNLYVTVCCAILEQEGRVTRALAIARGDNDEAFERGIERWYGNASFASFRTKLLWMYIASMPCFCASIGLLCLLKMPAGPGICSAIILLIAAFATTKTLLWVNEMFRLQILGLKKGEGTLDAPKVVFDERNGEGNHN